MGIFDKIFGKPAEVIDDRERWRRYAVRTGNLDWRGRPIDENPGNPIASRPGQAGYLKQVNRFLEEGGTKLASWGGGFKELIPGLFDRETAASERSHDRRFDPRRSRDFESMDEFLKDGAAKPPERKRR